MRAGVAFLLSFVIAVTIGSLILPDNPPKIRPKPLAGSVPPPPSMDFLPGLPSLIVPRLNDVSKRYEQAWQLLRAGKYRAAESAYLQILIRNPRDQKAMAGLVTLQRLMANQDREKLQQQAEAYRRAMAQGQATDEQYSPTELELLAEANLTGANEIVADQNVKVSSLSRVTPTPDIGHPAPAAPSDANVLSDPMTVVKERISQLATSLGLSPAKTDLATGETPKPAKYKENVVVVPENVVVVPVLDSHQPAAPSIAQTPAPSSSGDPNRSNTPIGNVVIPVVQQAQGGTVQSMPAPGTPAEAGSVTGGGAGWGGAPISHDPVEPKSSGSGSPSSGSQGSQKTGAEKENTNGSGSGSSSSGSGTTSGATSGGTSGGGSTGSKNGSGITGGGATGGSTTGTGSSGTAAGGSTAGTGGSTAGTGSSTAGTGGSTAGAGGSTAGKGGTTAGAGGTTAGAGGTTAGAGGTTAGAGGTTAGAGGTTAGAGGSTAGKGGTTAGAGGTTAGAGGTTAGAGGTTAGTGAKH